MANKIKPLSVLFSAACLLSSTVNAIDLRIDNVRLYQSDSGQFTQPSRLYIDDGKIVDVTGMATAPKTADKSVDAQGQYAVPGLTDLHVHLGSSGSNFGADFQYLPVSAAFNTNLYLGVTHIADLFSFDTTLNEAEKLKESNATPNLFYAGTLFTNPGGHGTQFGGSALEVTDNASIEKLWQQHIDRKPHLTKAVIESFGRSRPTLTDEQLAIIGKHSKEANLPYFVHVSSLKDAKRAIRAGATALAHGINNEPIDDEFIQLMLDNKVGYIPTLAVMHNHSYEKHEQGVSHQSDLLTSVHDKLLNCLFKEVPSVPLWKETSWKRRDIAYQNIQKLHEAGVLIGAGSDAGNPYTLHGVGLHNELRALKTAGLTPAQVINAATSNAARILGQEESIGGFAKGQEATFSLLQQNPLDDLKHLSSIDAIYKSGDSVDRQLLMQTNQQTTPLGAECHVKVEAKKVTANTIDSLDRSTQWHSLSDSALSGSSTAKVEPIKDGVSITTTLGKPTNFGAWSGAEIVFNKPADASSFTGVRLTYKGSKTPFHFSLYHAKVKDWDHFTTMLLPSSDWKTVEIPFSSLKQVGFGAPIEWSAKQLSGLSLLWRSQTSQGNNDNALVLSSIEYY